jgi:hypothetical protein
VLGAVARKMAVITEGMVPSDRGTYRQGSALLFIMAPIASTHTHVGRLIVGRVGTDCLSDALKSIQG